MVIPVGLWRAIGSHEPSGLRLIRGRDGESRVVFDNEGVGEETRTSHERERLREFVRLLYVTLTRALRTLVIPWSADGYPGPQLRGPVGPRSHVVGPRAATGSGRRGGGGEREAPAFLPDASPERHAGVPAAPFPNRVLPHKLASVPDAPRAARHESTADEPLVPHRERTRLNMGCGGTRPLSLFPGRRMSGRSPPMAPGPWKGQRKRGLGTAGPRNGRACLQASRGD